MTVHALLIISKAGGLVYNKDYGTGNLAKLSVNEYLVLAGTLHGVHAITAQINPTMAATPIGSGGMDLVESDSLRIYCHQTLTGSKIIIFADTLSPVSTLDAVCRKIFEVYCDYAMKNPFYTPEMPIRADLFDMNMNQLIRAINAA